MAKSFGWQAHLIDDVMRGQKRLVLFRNDANNTVEFNGSDGMWHREDAGVASDVQAGYVLPHGAWEAIEALVLPKAKDGEIAVLKEALELERARVDGVLNKVVKG